MEIRFKLLLATLAVFTFNVFGENLYKGDTSAETETDTLTRGNYSAELVPYAWDDSTAFDGKKSVRIDWKLKEHCVFLSLEFKKLFGEWISAANSPELKQGKTYTFSFYAKASKDNYPVTLKLLPSAGYIYWVSKGNYSKKLELSKDWKRYTLTFVPWMKEKAPIKAYSAILTLNNSPAGNIWYDAVQLEEGEQATPYQNGSALNVGVKLNSDSWSNIFFPDQKIVATIYTTIPQGQKAELKCKVIDYKGKIVEEFKRSVNSSTKIKVPLKLDKFGWFKITASLAVDGKTLSNHSANFLKIKRPVEIVKGIQPFAGICGTPSDIESFENNKRIGVKRLQLRADWGGVRADAIETSPGKYDWSDFESELKAIKEHGFLVKVLAPPFFAPRWLFSKEEVKQTKYLILDHSKHNQWCKFLGELMRRYGDMIDEIELGGEDNGHLGCNSYYKKLYPEEVKGGFLCGGQPFDDLCNMVKVGAEEIRKTHPNMRIGAIRPSQGYPGSNWIFVETMFKKTGKYFNIFPVDPYFEPYDFGPDIKSHNGTLEGRFYTYNLSKTYAKRYGCDQPVYISECGMAIDVRYPDESIYQQERAEMLAKDFITSRTAGFYAYDWFGMFAPGWTISHYTFSQSQNCRPQSAAAAYSATAQIVENVTDAKWLTPDKITRIAVLRKHDDKGVAAIWAEKGYGLKLPEKDSSRLVVTDMMGNVLPFGKGTFPLSTAPLYVKCDSYKELCGIMDNAKVDLSNWADIKFRRVSPTVGRIQFVNLSNRVDIEVHAAITVAGEEITRTVDVPRNSSNTCSIPLKGTTPVAVKATIAQSSNTLEKTFTLDKLVSIDSGNEATVKIASVKVRDDIYPPADPWVTWIGPDDLSADIFASWNKEYLYLKFKVKDDIHKNKFERGYSADGIQIAIDPKNNGPFTSSEHKLMSDDFEFDMALNDEGKTIYKHSFGKELCAKEDYSVKRAEKAKTTTYSLRIPWEKLRVKPHINMVFGMSFVIFDDDSGTGQDYYAPVGGGITGSLGGKNPALYKKFVLK